MSSGKATKGSQRMTIKDIADEAGVSITTASMVINGKAARYKIAPSTVERVESVVKKRQFSPNLHARAMASKRTFLVGVLLGGVGKSFWVDILQGIEEVLAAHDYHMILATSDFDPDREVEGLRFMDRKGVDGFVFSPGVYEDREEARAEARTMSANKPVVCVASLDEELPSVYVDTAEGGRLAAAHLWENGHRRVAYVGPLAPYDLRGRAFMAYWRERGLPVVSFADVESFLAEAGRFSGVFCFSDFVLLKLHQQALAAGIRVPEELSTIGFDNMAFLDLLVPRPTTVHQPKKELGTVAAETLLEMLGKKRSKASGRAFSPVLIEGASVCRLKPSNY